MEAEIVLVTGGSGFLGQHIVQELQHNDNKVTEIRILDLKPYFNRLGHANGKPIISYIGDIVDVNSIEEAFVGVSCVIHCASLVSYEYPSNSDQLNLVNVKGTTNIINLCKKFDISRLVFTSTTEITLVPYFRWWVFSAIVNQTEHKAVPPTDTSKLLFQEYAASKLNAEKLVLQANGSNLKSGGKLKTVALRPTILYGEEDAGFISILLNIADTFDGNLFRVGGTGGKQQMCYAGGKLKTVALRPTILYGEEDAGFISILLNIADTFDGNLFRVGGTGGKQQMCYAGNAAWAHVVAKNILNDVNNNIEGLPVFITDDSQNIDTLKFCERTIKNTDGSKRYHSPWWCIPTVVSYYLALILEFVMDKLYPRIIKQKIPISPTAVVSYLSSIVVYNRLRASVHLNYSPIYKPDAARKRSAKFYSEINTLGDENRIESCKYLSKNFKYIKMSKSKTSFVGQGK